MGCLLSRMVKLAARAFYDDVSIMGESQSKPGRIDNRGMTVIVLDALTRRQWVREEDLAKALKLHSKQLRRTLRFFEEEKLITRVHRKESAKGAKNFNAAIAATRDTQQTTKEGEEKMKMHMHSYCCLDYAQILDVVRYRMHRMKKKLKDELDSRNTIQEYICPNCGRRYSAFDALQLVSMEDEYFHCENCNGELVAESEKLAAEQLGDGDDNARKRRHEKLKDMYQKMEDQLKPLIAQLDRVKDLPAPEFGTLQAWEARARAASQANGDSNASDSKNIQGQGYGGTPMPFLGETSIEVALSGVEAKEETEPDIKPTALKVIPPWMIKQGMNLTIEQRRGIMPEPNVEHNSDDKKSSVDDKKPSADRDNEKSLQDEYLKAYYAALVKRQEEEEASRRIQQQTELSTSAAEEPVDRRVGMKSKREDDEDIEWESAAGTGIECWVGGRNCMVYVFDGVLRQYDIKYVVYRKDNIVIPKSQIGNSSQSYKLADLNAEADASDDDNGGDDDDIAWEEG
ncbi:hypothetical protein ZIOFF_047767 [Zingiber officinale]|uniref:HTH TFE/IIEalpha-type domain-containing protein n=1 Tax=Zingiber officinale TaxID=94328 RepID=A0A8J5KTX3_ZINOF|nr:hypothetical protein ZIOFF_047767 [Zingiber officinale]